MSTVWIVGAARTPMEQMVATNMIARTTQA